jgi:hypothetical protein
MCLRVQPVPWSYDKLMDDWMGGKGGDVGWLAGLLGEMLVDEWAGDRVALQFGSDTSPKDPYVKGLVPRWCYWMGWNL